MFLKVTNQILQGVWVLLLPRNRIGRKLYNTGKTKATQDMCRSRNVDTGDYLMSKAQEVFIVFRHL